MTRFIRSFVCVAALALSAPSWAADTWRIVMPFAAGGSTDVLARLLAEKLRSATGHNVIVENIVGANGNIGAAAVARAKPDGTTMLITSEAYATVNPILFKDSMKYDPESLAPISLLGEQSAVLVTSPASGIKSFDEFVSRARTNGVSYSSAGIGSTSHLATEYLNAEVGGMKLTHVPYVGGAPAINAVLGGQVDAGFVIAGNVLPHVRAGKLVPLAVSGKQRLAQLPDVPTVAERGHPRYAALAGVVMLVPAATPVEIRARLTRLVQEAMKTPEVQKHLETNGFVTLATDGEQAQAWLAREKKLWTDLIVGKNILK